MIKKRRAPKKKSYVTKVTTQNPTGEGQSASDNSDTDILSQAVRHVTDAITAESTFRDEALEDLKFRIGDQWPDKIKKERESVGQPCLQFNLIPKFIRQVTGDARQNVPSIKVIPVDRFADKNTAAIFKGMIRHIEYHSDASDVYVHGLEQAATIGRGWWQITTDYVDHESFDQEIYLKRVDNPLSVYVDPMATGPCYVDAEWMCIREWVNIETFKRDYPDTDPQPGNVSIIDGLDREHWYSEDSLCKAAYWVKEPAKRKLLHVTITQPGKAPYDSTIFEDDSHLETVKQFSNVEIVKSREVNAFKVKCYIIVGHEILDVKEWSGQYIPLIPCIGESVNVDGNEYLHGIVRFAKDPQRHYNYWMTMGTEQIALAPKIPYLVTGTMIEDFQSEWDTAHESAYPYLRYKPDPQAPGAKPERLPPPELSPAYVQMMQISQQGLNDATGQFKPSLGQESNETSGRAILARQKEGDTGTYVYIDNWVKAVTHTGKVLIDLIPKIYDTPRVVRIINDKDEEEMISVNNDAPEGVDRIYDLTVGKYDVRVITGPSYTTKKVEMANSMIEFMRIYPGAAPVLGDLIAKAMDWEGADEVGERLKALAQHQGLLPPDPGSQPPAPPGAPPPGQGTPPGAPPVNGPQGQMGGQPAPPTLSPQELGG